MIKWAPSEKQVTQFYGGFVFEDQSGWAQVTKALSLQHKVIIDMKTQFLKSKCRGNQCFF